MQPIKVRRVVSYPLLCTTNGQFYDHRLMHNRWLGLRHSQVKRLFPTSSRDLSKKRKLSESSEAIQPEMERCTRTNLTDEYEQFQELSPRDYSLAYNILARPVSFIRQQCLA